MAAEPQKVVVIHDASRDVCAKAIKKALKDMRPQPDELTIIAILDHFSSPRFKLRSFKPGDNSSVTVTKLIVGYKIWVDTSQFVATTDIIVEEELARKRDNYLNSQQFMVLSEYCEKTKMAFNIDVVARPFLEVASTAANSSGATWLILDRQMHKDKKRLDKLPCGMYRIRSDNSIQKLKDPTITSKNTKSLIARQAQAIYMEKTPRNLDEEISPKRHRSSPSEQFSSFCSTEASSSNMYQLMKDKEREKVPNIEQETAGIFYRALHRGDNEASQMEAEFTNPLCSVCKKKRPKFGWKKDFSFAELYTATQGFSQKNFLSEGGFGSVYKGVLNGITIAVKHHKNAGLQGEKEFKSEVNLLSRARHENVVILLGSCVEGKQRLLVYEYVCNGSLDQHLSQHSRFPLSWEERIKVAIGTAKGLLYLHENNIIHRDMRPNNILITHDLQPLLGDFGLARNQHKDSIHSTEVVGTLGYLAPEYAEYGKVSAKIDVYSFGVVLLQLITGMRTTDKRLEGRSLVGWARPLLKARKYSDLIDERIINSHDFHQLFWMVRLAEKCLIRDPQKRLNMIAVVNALSCIEEGNTCDIIIRDFSPPRSDSSYSLSDSSVSVGNVQEFFESEDQLESLSTNSTSSDSFNMMSQMIVRLPPSPPIERTSSSRSSTFKYDESSVETNEDQN